ncbi:hypothetical protein [Lacrimispora indolis]|uniref:hypothetical protein n=1 Tax=Lacrimispora indolis TaxID=69825 RepID=UPI00140AA8F0|nr:hypothetical protein [Lacrimispora indolis]
MSFFPIPWVRCAVAVDKWHKEYGMMDRQRQMCNPKMENVSGIKRKGVTAV